MSIAIPKISTLYTGCPKKQSTSKKNMNVKNEEKNSDCRLKTWIIWKTWSVQQSRNCHLDVSRKKWIQTPINWFQVLLSIIGCVRLIIE
jgi:O-acetyl-ADP-ribose deacetylase (regulator of RNase III)